MSNVHDQLRALCDVVGVPLGGLTLDELDVIAIRVSLLDEPTPIAIAAVVDSVRWARPQADCCTPKVYPGPTGLRARHAWGCVWAGQPVGGERDRKLVMHQATAVVDQLAERRGLSATERRMHVHPACKAAFADGATACSTCTFLLCTDDDCDHDACANERAWEGYFG